MSRTRNRTHAETGHSDTLDVTRAVCACAHTLCRHLTRCSRGARVSTHKNSNRPRGRSVQSTTAGRAGAKYLTKCEEGTNKQTTGWNVGAFARTGVRWKRRPVPGSEESAFVCDGEKVVRGRLCATECVSKHASHNQHIDSAVVKNSPVGLHRGHALTKNALQRSVVRVRHLHEQDSRAPHVSGNKAERRSEGFYGSLFAVSCSLFAACDSCPLARLLLLMWRCGRLVCGSDAWPTPVLSTSLPG